MRGRREWQRKEQAKKRQHRLKQREWGQMGGRKRKKGEGKQESRKKSGRQKSKGLVSIMRVYL